MLIVFYILLVLCFLLSGSTLILTNENMVSRYPAIVKKLKSPFIGFLLISALFCYRYLCNIPKITFFTYIMGNVGIIMCFYFVRFHYITVKISTKVDGFLLFTLSIISAFFSISRLFFRIGFILNQKLDTNPEIHWILEGIPKPAVGFFTSLGKRLTGNMPINPASSGVDRHYAFDFCTFCATFIGAASGVYLGYEAYQSRQVNIRAVNAAERSADISERALDIQERNLGQMSQETYVRKWDEFGNRRK